MKVHSINITNEAVSDVSICSSTEKTLHLGLSRDRALKLFSRIHQPRPGCTVITGDALLDSRLLHLCRGRRASEARMWCVVIL